MPGKFWEPRQHLPLTFPRSQQLTFIHTGARQKKGLGNLPPRWKEVRRVAHVCVWVCNEEGVAGCGGFFTTQEGHHLWLGYACQVHEVRLLQQQCAEWAALSWTTFSLPPFLHLTPGSIPRPSSVPATLDNQGVECTLGESCSERGERVCNQGRVPERPAKRG